MSAGYLRYLQRIDEGLQHVRTPDALAAIDAAARAITASVATGGVLYAFGASHAGLMVQDLFYRAGGLAAVQPILPRELMLDTKPVDDTTRTEQTLGLGAAYLDPYSVGSGDIVLVVSVSGRNPVPVELAIAARDRGALVIALTSVAYSRSVGGRGGVPRLFEVADLVLDLAGVPGDASVELGGRLPAAGPTSSVIGAAILHGLAVEVATRLHRAGVEPPVFASANLDNASAWNEALIERYRTRVDYFGT